MKEYGINIKHNEYDKIIIESLYSFDILFNFDFYEFNSDSLIKKITNLVSDLFTKAKKDHCCSKYFINKYCSNIDISTLKQMKKIEFLSECLSNSLISTYKNILIYENEDVAFNEEELFLSIKTNIIKNTI